MADKPVSLRALDVYASRRKWKNPSTTRTYYAWRSMRGRCLNPSNQAWPNYGGRGIRVCKRWVDNYDAFYEDMGPCPDGLSLDRINCNGNYEPGNCRWAGWDTQARNKRTTRLITHQGKTKPMVDWADDLGIGVDTLYRRLDVYQMPLGRALTQGSLVPSAECGTRQAYENGCRCGSCRAAHAKSYRERQSASVRRQGSALFEARSGECLAAIKAASAQQSVKIAPFSPRWAGRFVATALGLDVENKTQRLIIAELLRCMVAAGMLLETSAYDAKAGREIRIYVTATGAAA